MKLIKQTYDACLLFSAAMVLDAEPADLLLEIGHDGREIMFPEVIGTIRQRSFHIQEIIDCCLKRGRSLTPIDIAPCTAPDGHPDLAREIWDREDAKKRIRKLLTGTRAILIGRTSHKGLGHACAWDGEKVYDPRGMICEIGETFIHQAWLVNEIKSDC
jgi:hypothetical protein